MGPVVEVTPCLPEKISASRRRPVVDQGPGLDRSSLDRVLPLEVIDLADALRLHRVPRVAGIVVDHTMTGMPVIEHRIVGTCRHGSPL